MNIKLILYIIDKRMNRKIRLMTDLHLEFEKDISKFEFTKSNDICVLADFDFTCNI